MTRELLFSVTKKDFTVDWFSGSGAGGQHRNKHQNCIRLRHPESGAEATGTESRSREQNKDAAFKRLTASPTFLAWLKRKAAEIMGQSTENVMAELSKRVAEQMKPENLKIEYGQAYRGYKRSITVNYYIGIDPGKTGAIALNNENGENLHLEDFDDESKMARLLGAWIKTYGRDGHIVVGLEELGVVWAANAGLWRLPIRKERWILGWDTDCLANPFQDRQAATVEKRGAVQNR